MFFSLLLAAYAYPTIKTLEFTTPGKYLLYPPDYGCSSNLIIEMWGAGASGSCGYDSAGGSGAYVKGVIFTNNQVFTLQVGKGGNSKICYGQSGIYGDNGTYSSLTSSDNKINITVDGGKTESPSGISQQPAKIIKVSGINVSFAEQGQTSRYPRCNCNNPPCFGCATNGGSAFHGGLGGNGFSGGCGTCFETNSQIYPNDPKNGLNPGGGGGGTNCLSVNPKSTSISGVGGNGSIIIYYATSFLGDLLCKNSSFTE
jgi:hypothetical protein